MKIEATRCHQPLKKIKKIIKSFISFQNVGHGYFVVFTTCPKSESDKIVWLSKSPICAVVNQLWNRLLVQWKLKFFSNKIVKPTVGWQVHIRYHSLPVYKEFPDYIIFLISFFPLNLPRKGALFFYTNPTQNIII